MGNEIPTGLEFIILETNPNENTVSEEEMTIFFLPKTGKTHKYRSEHLTEININGSPLASFSQNQIFELKIEKTPTVYNYCFLDIVENRFDDGLNLKEQFGGLLEKVVYLKNNFEFLLTPHGDIHSIENRKKLKDKWETLREEIKTNPLLSEMSPSQMQEMIAKGDLEFSDSYPLKDELKNSVFHSYLFFPVYGRMFHIGKTYEMPKSNHMMSMMFSGEKIPLRTTMTISEDKEAGEYLVKVES